MELLHVVAVLLGHLADVFAPLGSTFSVASLGAALALALAFLLLKRRARRRPLGFRLLRRALFPKRLIAHPSSKADFGLFCFNVFAFGVILGWAVLSYRALSDGALAGLNHVFGSRRPLAAPGLLSRSLLTFALFLAYEFGYWLDHYLSHKIPCLWELHKVHHTANVLTPLTAWRVHPLDTLKFYNILAIVMALASAGGRYLFGESLQQFTISNNNLILVVFVYAYVHLQHTELWIAFRGGWGRIFLSPAHHQVHHSADPAHFDKNLGSCLAIWDWLFGTLYVPGKTGGLRFGVVERASEPHTFGGCMIAPVRQALSRLFEAPLARLLRRGAPRPG